MSTVFDYSPSFRFLRRNLRRAQKIAREGRATTGTVVGIWVRRQSEDSPDRHEWALLVEGRRLGIRQHLAPDVEERVRLGDALRVKVDRKGGALIVEDGEHRSSELNHKVVEPPPDGIDDQNHDLTKERSKAAPATITVRSAAPSEVFGMTVLNTDLQVSVQPEGATAYDTVLKRELVPFYASHLVAPGTVLPGTARAGQGKVRVDWPAAAMAHPGNGEPPVFPIPAPEASD